MFNFPNCQLPVVIDKNRLRWKVKSLSFPSGPPKENFFVSVAALSVNQKMDLFLRTVKVAILALCLPVTIVVDFVACIAYSIFFTIVVAPSVCGSFFLQYVCLLL